MRVENNSATTARVYLELKDKRSSTTPIRNFIEKQVSKLGKLLLNPMFILESKALSGKYKAVALAIDFLENEVVTYPKKEGGFFKEGETSREIGRFFKEASPGSDNWDVLKNNYDNRNLQSILALLKQVYDHTPNTNLLQIRSAQVLAKKLISGCSDLLNPGFEMDFPIVDATGNAHLVRYTLDTKFDLWEGIPAFGFVDIEGKASPILIFRSTNNELQDEDAPASLIANLHPKGPAWKLYRNSKDKVEAWLKEKTVNGENKARIIGYSQGGTLAAYFLTHHSQWVSQNENEPSYILDAPGVFSELASKWRALDKKPNVEYYVCKGDYFPKVGSEMIGRAFEVSLPKRMSPYESHTALTFLAPTWKIEEIDIEKEKKSTVRQAVSLLHKKLGYSVYSFLKDALLPIIQEVAYKI